METQQIITLRNNTRREIERRGLNRLLEEDALDVILSFASDFPADDDEAVNFILDYITISSEARVIDMDLVHRLVNTLNASTRVDDSLQQYTYLESNFSFGASESAIQALPNAFPTDGFSSSWACGVCLEDESEANDGAKQLPCKHIFHTHCIISWLELRNSCPLCRCQLPT